MARRHHRLGQRLMREQSATNCPRPVRSGASILRRPFTFRRRRRLRSHRPYKTVVNAAGGHLGLQRPRTSPEDTTFISVSPPAAGICSEMGLAIDKSLRRHPIRFRRHHRDPDVFESIADAGRSRRASRCRRRVSRWRRSFSPGSSALTESGWRPATLDTLKPVRRLMPLSTLDTVGSAIRVHAQRVASGEPAPHSPCQMRHSGSPPSATRSGPRHGRTRTRVSLI
jgi:hypothetical protein